MDMILNGCYNPLVTHFTPFITHKHARITHLENRNPLLKWKSGLFQGVLGYDFV